MIKLPNDVEIIIQQLNQAGYASYVVGGCVRDSLLGLEPEDWDVCTSALPEETKQVFSGFHIIETGIQHGTVTVRVNHQSYEVTTFRKDGDYKDFRHPETVEFVSKLKDDLSRRDFTVNAMAYHPKTGVVDYFNGQKDLASKTICCVGDAKTRFQEDALRILRGLRFAARYGFSIESSTKNAMKECKELLSLIAKERISEELKKLLLGDYPETILLDYREIFAQFIPEFATMFDMEQKNPHHQYDVWEHTVKSVAYADKNLFVRLAVLFHDIGKPQTFSMDTEGIGHFYSHAKAGEALCETILRRLKFDAKTIAYVKELVKYHDIQIEPTEKAVKKQLNRIGAEQFERLLLVKEADAKTTVNAEIKLKKIEAVRKLYQMVIEKNACFTLKDLEISGNDLIFLGIPEGKQVGATLLLLLDMVMENKLQNKRESLVHFVQENLKNI